MIDYKKGKIYKIVNDLNDEIYVGSTVNTLSQRMAHHKYNFEKYPERKIYKFIRDIGGDWSHCKIILIEDYPCERKEQLLQREQYYKKIATLNDNNCYGLDKKRYKKWYESNKDNIKEYKEKYYESNKDKILEKGAKINICICGKEYTKWNKSQHEKTKYHKKYIKQQQEK